MLIKLFTLLYKISCFCSLEIFGKVIILSISIGRVEAVGESEPYKILLWPTVLIS